MQNDFLSDLQWRGLVHQCTDLSALGTHLSAGPVTLYCGFDPTAESLHVGNLIPLISLARFQRAGHRPLALVGGATGLVGDPSGKSAERTLQDNSEVARRVELIKAQLAHFVDISDPAKGAVVNNLDWTQSLTMLEFLREVGKHFSVNAMVARDSIKTRLEREGEGISFTEFSYMLLQAFDFLALARREGCTLQIGGSDQWGNMCSGVDLIRRKEGRDSLALTFPLLTTHDGKKFGKSERGAIWLDAKMTSSWDFFQFWLNVDDQDVVRMLKLFTFVDRPSIEALERATAERPQERQAQRKLAWEMTALTHGVTAAEEAVATASVLFGKESASVLSEGALKALTLALPCQRFNAPSELPQLNKLLVALGLETSMTRANEAVKSGAVTVNGVKQTEAGGLLKAEDALQGGFFLVRKGRKSFGIATLGWFSNPEGSSGEVSGGSWQNS